MRGLLSAGAENRAGRAPCQLATSFISSQASNIAYQRAAGRHAVEVAVSGRMLQVLDASSGATLERAVTSSAAIPGVWPLITIKGERWIDGGVRSMLNADLATGCDVVIVVSCFALEVWVGSRIQTWRPQTRR